MMSYAASNLSHPTTSLKGRPANSFAVVITAQISGGVRNGRRSTGRSRSAHRGRITMTLESVPPPTNPTVASSITWIR